MAITIWVVEYISGMKWDENEEVFRRLLFWERWWHRGCGGDGNRLPLLFSCRTRRVFQASTYHSELVGRSAVLEQDVDDVRVALLRCLVQRRVPVLHKRDKGKAAAGTAHSGHTAARGTAATLTFVLALTFAECCRRKFTIFMFP